MPLTQDQQDLIYTQWVKSFFLDITEHTSTQDIRSRITDIQSALFTQNRLDEIRFSNLRKFYLNLDTVENGAEQKQYLLTSFCDIITEKAGRLNMTPAQLGWNPPLALQLPAFLRPDFLLHEVEVDPIGWFTSRCTFPYFL